MLRDYIDSASCRKCGSLVIEKKLKSAYSDGLPNNPFANLRYKKDDYEYLQCYCNSCGYNYSTNTLDSQETTTD